MYNRQMDRPMVGTDGLAEGTFCLNTDPSALVPTTFIAAFPAASTFIAAFSPFRNCVEFA